MYDLVRTVSRACYWARLNACAEDCVLHIPTILAELHHGAFLPVFCRNNVLL